MIVCDIKLLGSNSDRETVLGLLIIDQQDTSHGGRRGDYRVRMYRKGTKLFKNEGRGWSFAHGTNPKPIREGSVLNHARLTEPVQNLVAKALKELGYG